MSDEYRYGDDHTIHKTGKINIERDKKTGEVISVWFRCMALPFTDTVVDPYRAAEMRQEYEQAKLDGTLRPIKAVVVHCDEKQDD